MIVTSQPYASDTLQKAKPSLRGSSSWYWCCLTHSGHSSSWSFMQYSVRSKSCMRHRLRSAGLSLLSHLRSFRKDSQVSFSARLAVGFCPSKEALHTEHVFLPVDFQLLSTHSRQKLWEQLKSTGSRKTSRQMGQVKSCSRGRSPSHGSRSMVSSIFLV